MNTSIERRLEALESTRAADAHYLTTLSHATLALLRELGFSEPSGAEPMSQLEGPRVPAGVGHEQS
jgi:hypothetical protein